MNHVRTSIRLRAAALMLLALCTVFALSYVSWSSVTHAQDASDEADTDEESDEEKIEYAPHPTELVDLTIKVDIAEEVMEEYGLDDSLPQDMSVLKEEYPDVNDGYGIRINLWNADDSREVFLPLCVKTMTLPMYMQKYQWSARLQKGYELSLKMEPLTGRLDLSLGDAQTLDVRWSEGYSVEKTFDFEMDVTSPQVWGGVLDSSELQCYGSLNWSFEVQVGNVLRDWVSRSRDEDSVLNEIPKYVILPRAQMWIELDVTLEDRYGSVGWRQEREFEGDEQDILVNLGAHAILFPNLRFEGHPAWPGFNWSEHLEFSWGTYAEAQDPGRDAVSTMEGNAFSYSRKWPGELLNSGTTRTVFAPDKSILYLWIQSRFYAPQLFRINTSGVSPEFLVTLTQPRVLHRVTARVSVAGLGPDSPPSHIPDLRVRVFDVPKPDASEKVHRQAWSETRGYDIIPHFDLDLGRYDFDVLLPTKGDYLIALLDGGRIDYRRFVLKDPVVLGKESTEELIDFGALPLPEYSTKYQEWRLRFITKGGTAKMPYAGLPEPVYPLGREFTSYRHDTRREDIPEKVLVFGEEYPVVKGTYKDWRDGLKLAVHLPSRVRVTAKSEKASPADVLIIPGRFTPSQIIEMKGLYPAHVQAYRTAYERSYETWAPLGTVTIVAHGEHVGVLEIQRDTIEEVFCNSRIPEEYDQPPPDPIYEYQSLPSKDYEFPEVKPAEIDWIPAPELDLLAGQEKGSCDYYYFPTLGDEAVAQHYYTYTSLDESSWNQEYGDGVIIEVLNSWTCHRVGNTWMIQAGEKYQIIERAVVGRRDCRVVTIPVTGLEIGDPWLLDLQIAPMDIYKVMRGDQLLIASGIYRQCGTGGYPVMPAQWTYFDNEITIYNLPEVGDWVVLPKRYWNRPAAPAVVIKEGQDHAPNAIDFSNTPSARLHEDWWWAGRNVRLKPKGNEGPYLEVAYWEDHNQRVGTMETGYIPTLAPGTWEAGMFVDAVRDPVVVTFEVTKDTKVVPFPEEFKKWFPEIDAAKEKRGEEEGD